MIGLGVRGLVIGDFALVWQRVPIEHLPARQYLAYACAAVALVGGTGLLIGRAERIAAAILSIYLLLWLVLLKLPAVVVMPQMEATWLGFGEISVIFAGAWILFATQSRPATSSSSGFTVGRDGIRNARVLFALALPMIGLSHFFYAKETAAFVPAWMPWHYGWAYLTGAGSIVAAIALLLGIWPRLAATLEASMLSMITLLVWGPGLTGPPVNLAWTGFLISSAIASGAWVVADSYRGVAWLGSAGKPRAVPP